ncbi:MutS domain V domain containing protein [Amanita muscaria]
MLPREDDTCNTLTKLSNGSKKRGRKPKVLSNALSTNTRAPTRKPNIQGDETVDDLPRTGLAREIHDNLNQFPHCLLLTRVGQFYEAWRFRWYSPSHLTYPLQSYFEQAVEIAQLLNIKLTSRKWGGQRVHMCGFPIMHLDKYLKVLVQQNKRFVALCEEFPRHSDFGVKEFERRVVRVVTPGTLIDEPFLNPYENNYLLAASTIEEPSLQSPVGLAWIDVSTGEFFSECSTCEQFLDELARINPKEVVLDEKLRSISSHPILLALGEESACVSYIQPTLVTHTRSTDASLSTAEVSSINLLNTFLRANLLEYMPAISPPKQEARSDRMQIDSHTIKALEIREGFIEGGTKGSLFSAIKRTTTTSGARLLARWLCSPSTSLSEINARQSLVSLFFTRPHLRADVIHLLRGSEDIGRVSQKFLLGRGDVSDLLALSRTVNVWSTIKHRIEEERRLERMEKGEGFNDEDWNSIDSLLSRLLDFHELTKRIVSAIGDGGGLSSSVELPEPVSATVTGPEPTEMYANGTSYLNSGKCLIKPSFSQKIATLHLRLKELLEERVRLELHFQETYNAPSLSLRSSPAHGLHVHLTKAKRDRAKLDGSANFVGISESATTKCYFNKQWSQLGGQISETAMTLIDAEKEAFEGLRAEVNLYATALRRNAHILDELDIALGFANLAAEMNFIRPVLTDDASYQVLDGRHPSVELGLLTSGRVFTSNSLEMTPESRLHVITGPNMAGKSTFLRQAALITIMAQIGSFVPASSASIGIVDKLFSRIGAKDDLFHDRSTFMVEMLETAEILRRATPRSLVIMDEVGRGTTVRDGLAIAFATVHHLSLHNKCRALFATHFHELADMLGYPEHKSRGPHGHISFFCTDVHETDDDHFAYSYRLRPGVNRDSHGLKVAQLAGMPQVAMQVARDALSWLNNNRVYSTILPYSEVIKSIQADPDI